MSAATVHPRRPPDPRLVQRCLLLAVLLHVWLVLMFGNAPGSAAPGQSAWGSLTVKLRGLSGTQTEAPPATQPGGSPPREPGAASPSTRPPGNTRTQPVAADSTGTDADAPAPPSTATLVLPEGFRPIERQDLSAPAALPVPALPAADVPTGALSRLEARPDAAVTPLTPAARLDTPTKTPANSPALPLPDTPLPPAVSRLEAAAASVANAALPRPTELRPDTAPAPALPTAAELPRPIARLEAAQAPTNPSTPLPRAADLRATPTSPLPTLPTTALPTAVQRLEAATADTDSLTPVPRASALRAPPASTSATAALQAAVGAQDLPAPVGRLDADSPGGVTPQPPVAPARAALDAPTATDLAALTGPLPGQVSAPAGPAQGDPAARMRTAPPAAAGGPDGSTRLGPALPPPPPLAAASAPRAPLNLSLPRGDMTARRGSSGVIDLIPPPPERKSKLEQSVEEAANKDCRKAYSGAGLLAIVPLAIDTARGKGCKW